MTSAREQVREAIEESLRYEVVAWHPQATDAIGDAADAASDVWEPKYNRMRSALERINAIKTDVPLMGFQEYYDAVTDIAREALNE